MAKDTPPTTMFQKIFLALFSIAIGGFITAFWAMQKNIVRLSESNAVMSVQISHIQDQANCHVKNDVVTEAAHVLAIVRGN